MSTDPFIVERVQQLEKRVEKLEGRKEKGMTNTIDTPEFRKLLSKYRESTPLSIETLHKCNALITHIDAKIAEAVKDAVSEALTRFVDADMENKA